MLAKGSNLLGRSDSTRGALVLLKKDDAWWSMVQDERTDLLLKSRHVEMGLKALPNVARRLHHVRDMPGWDGEWDFLTWFEYTPEDERLFDELLVGLRASPEWGHVEREVDIRLMRCDWRGVRAREPPSVLTHVRTQLVKPEGQGSLG